MTTRTQKAFAEWDMQDLSIGHKLREAKRFCEELEKESERTVKELETLNLILESEARESADINAGLADETKERAEAQIAMADIRDWIQNASNDDLQSMMTYSDRISFITRAMATGSGGHTQDEECAHDEQDHGICLACGEDRDMNSPTFGKKTFLRAPSSTDEAAQNH